VGFNCAAMQGAFLQHSSAGVIEESISQQLNLAARLRHIVDIIKVCRLACAFAVPLFSASFLKPVGIHLEECEGVHLNAA
jgi:hypothetical protein